jgi:hypothetical protein
VAFLRIETAISLRSEPISSRNSLPPLPPLREGGREGKREGKREGQALSPTRPVE